MKLKLGRFLNYYWIAAIALGWIYTIFSAKKSCKNKGSSNFAENALSSVWIGFGISAFIIGFIPAILYLVKAPFLLSYYFITPIISLFLGMTYFATSYLMKLKWMRFVALGWWIGGIILFLIQNIYSFLIFAALIILFQTIPGIIIRKNHKK